VMNDADWMPPWLTDACRQDSSTIETRLASGREKKTHLPTVVGLRGREKK